VSVSVSVPNADRLIPPLGTSSYFLNSILNYFLLFCVDCLAGVLRDTYPEPIRRKTTNSGLPSKLFQVNRTACPHSGAVERAFDGFILSSEKHGCGTAE